MSPVMKSTTRPASVRSNSRPPTTVQDTRVLADSAARLVMASTPNPRAWAIASNVSRGMVGACA